MKYTAAVITVSDKGARGERTDTSGPAVCALLESRGWDVVHTAVIPDELETIQAELIRCADEKGIALVVTTGGTGFSPRDVTPEATLSVISRRAAGLPEAMRAESRKLTPRGCLSRAEAGMRGRTLIVNLPGSEKAAKENLLAVIDPIRHGVEMLLGSGSADCAAEPAARKAPSLDQWLREAKAHPDAPKVGMYLAHNGTVRQTPRAKVREGDESAADVTGLVLSYKRETLETLVAETYRLPGIYYVRAWLNEGKLQVGDDMMTVLVGGDIRPHVVEALQTLVGRIKAECVTEQELY